MFTDVPLPQVSDRRRQQHGDLLQLRRDKRVSAEGIVLHQQGRF
jgi:hypothetical protein